MSEFRVGGECSVTRVEELLAQLQLSPNDSDLVLPTSLRSRQLGGTSALLQLIISWRRACPAGRLRIHVHESDSEDQATEKLRHFATTDHGLCALALAGEVADRAGTRTLDVAQLVRDRLDSMDSVEDAQRGAKALLLCVDDTIYGRPQTLYQPRIGSRDPQLRDYDGFLRLARELRGAITHGPGTRAAGEHIDSPDMAGLLLELVANTHHWARSDPAGARLAPSIRGLRIELHALNPDHSASRQGELPQLRRYLASGPLRPFQGRTRLVELSVFDSGPGMAARRMFGLGRAYSDVAMEYEATRDCLATHFSTANDPARGSGLHRVMTALTKLNGFLRLRTGRLHLLRDFAATPYDPHGGAVEPFLEDWQAKEGHAAAPPAAGTTLTLLFPLPYLEQEQMF